MPVSFGTSPGLPEGFPVRLQSKDPSQEPGRPGLPSPPFVKTPERTRRTGTRSMEFRLGGLDLSLKTWKSLGGGSSGPQPSDHTPNVLDRPQGVESGSLAPTQMGLLLNGPVEGQENPWTSVVSGNRKRLETNKRLKNQYQGPQ